MNHNTFNGPEPDELDNLIFSNRKLEAIKLIRERRNVDLAAAMELFSARYSQLRAICPERFKGSDA
ncbi:MAG TPA: hypothetical protein VN281_22270 [Verrucomicrobiae bacterium]|jgi:hypothetical protein|nr:hypothetical protein [Verrucomicrobiae bacterium]